MALDKRKKEGYESYSNQRKSQKKREKVMRITSYFDWEKHEIV